MKQTLVWKGGEHPFWLRIGELRALQQHCDAGPFWVYGRLISGQWRVEDVRETLRLGLIGGGMSEKDAGKLVDQSLEDHALYAHVLPAVEIIKAAIFGDDPDDDVGEATPQGMNQAENNPLAAKSDSPTSTPVVPPSA